MDIDFTIYLCLRNKLKSLSFYENISKSCVIAYLSIYIIYLFSVYILKDVK